MELYQDWRHDTCHGCARCVSRGDPAVWTAEGWLVWVGWATECMAPWTVGAPPDFDICRLAPAGAGAVGVER
jgi:hypothetical protein